MGFALPHIKKAIQTTGGIVCKIIHIIVNISVMLIIPLSFIPCSLDDYCEYMVKHMHFQEADIDSIFMLTLIMAGNVFLMLNWME